MLGTRGEPPVRLESDFPPAVDNAESSAKWSEQSMVCRGRFGIVIGRSELIFFSRDSDWSGISREPDGSSRVKERLSIRRYGCVNRNGMGPSLDTY